ncbi:MAG: hypothetical protein WCA21_15650 [Terracidiphilus sp.]
MTVPPAQVLSAHANNPCDRSFGRNLVTFPELVDCSNNLLRGLAYPYVMGVMGSCFHLSRWRQNRVSIPGASLYRG